MQGVLRPLLAELSFTLELHVTPLPLHSPAHRGLHSTVQRRGDSTQRADVYHCE